MIKLVLIGNVDENIIKHINHTGVVDGLFVIVMHTSSIAEAEAFFLNEKEYDLILVDLDLAGDALFPLFERPDFLTPVIYISGNNALQPFTYDANGIYYITRPLTPSALEHAFLHFQKIREHFIHDLQQHTIAPTNGNSRHKLVIQKGEEFLLINLCDVVYFFSKNRIVYLVDKQNKKYITDFTNLNQVISELKYEHLFKANRQYVVNMEHVLKFRRLSKNKISLEMVVQPAEGIYMAYNNAVEFKEMIRSI